MTTMVNQETVYGSNEDSHVVMSEKVQTLAGNIYQEFEKMIFKYDQDVVKGLMPLIVNVLECLDLCYTENQEQEVEIELLKEDNEQLVTQYEREKQLRKESEKKYLEVEDAIEEEKKGSLSKIESLESILRMFELKARNAGDHVSRLEEKENEMKHEYNKLHERYTDLFKTHMDYMERTKILMGTDRLEQLGVARNQLPSFHLGLHNRSSGPVSYGFTSLENSLHSLSNPLDVMSISSPKKESHLSTSLKTEIQNQTDFQEMSRLHTQDKEGNWVEMLSPECDDDVQLEDVEATQVESIDIRPKSLKTKEERQANNLYQELKFQEIENPVMDADDLSDMTGGWVHPGEYASSVNDNFFGMGKEVENLIMENNELLATKNALNIVKDDLIAKVDELTSEQEILREEISSLQAVKSRLKLRVQELMDELKQVKQEAEKMSKANKSDDEEDVPMSQRKRFTRVEMARVLMDRNQYKEKLMELQEAVRFRDMLRASQTDSAEDKKKNKGIWTLFSNLFAGSERNQRNTTPLKINYNVPSHQISPSMDGIRRATMEKNRKNIDFLDNNDFSSEKLQQRRANERREQYRQVKAHVKKDDGRLQAYGWSLPAKIPSQFPSPMSSRSYDGTRTTQIPVPVPVFCRPLRDQETGMKIWCAAGVNLSSGKTRDGGLVIGASVFYSETTDRPDSPKVDETSPEVDKLDAELREQEKIRREMGDEQLTSSLVWICTSTHSISKVTIIDAKSPDDALGSFNVCSSHLLCIASVPGAKENDYLAAEELHNAFEASQQTEEDSLQTEMLEKNNLPADCKIGNISLVSCSTGEGYENTVRQVPEIQNGHTSEMPGENHEGQSEVKAESLQSLEQSLTCAKDMENSDSGGETNVEVVEKMSSVQPTMWLGSQNGSIYVHSSVAQWDQCIHSVVLPDSVLAIVHIHGRVLAALADGKVAVFHRGMDGQWDLNNYHLVEIGSRNHSVRCMVVVHDKVWCGFQNKICVMDPKTMRIESYFVAHPRKESQVRQMACAGDGVWVSIRLDSTLRLYHAHTYEHLQDVDIEPYVSKMLGTGKLGFSFVRITALLISASRLWMGTGNGVIISVPFEDTNRNETGMRGPGTGIRVYCTNDKITPGSFIPYCSMAHAQLSFHGHRDSVKFFVSVPGASGLTPITCDRSSGEDGRNKRKPSTMLVMAGGEGYIDFRIVEPKEEQEWSSHLIVWQLPLSVKDMSFWPVHDLEYPGER